jgi:large subunit ribosomal protein L17
MRHGKKFNHLGRTSSHRKSMLSNMASSLILKKRIKTTVAKAKALRLYVEPLLTKSKSDTTHSRRVVFSYLQNKYSLQELFGDIASRIAERPGGYTRILKTGNRLGDNAEMCIIELVDYNEGLLKTEKSAKSKTRRGRSKKKYSDSEDTMTTAEVVEETTAAVEVVAEEESVETKKPEASSETQEGTTDDESKQNPEAEGSEEKNKEN